MLLIKVLRCKLTLLMMRLLSPKNKYTKIFEKHLNPVMLSTHLPGFQSLFRLFVSFCMGQISHQQHKGSFSLPTGQSWELPELPDLYVLHGVRGVLEVLKLFWPLFRGVLVWFLSLSPVRRLTGGRLKKYKNFAVVPHQLQWLLQQEPTFDHQHLCLYPFP